jgi:hypothetical protein
VLPLPIFRHPEEPQTRLLLARAKVASKDPVPHGVSLADDFAREALRSGLQALVPPRLELIRSLGHQVIKPCLQSRLLRHVKLLVRIKERWSIKVHCVRVQQLDVKIEVCRFDSDR